MFTGVQVTGNSAFFSLHFLTYLRCIGLAIVIASTFIAKMAYLRPFFFSSAARICSTAVLEGCVSVRGSVCVPVLLVRNAGQQR